MKTVSMALVATVIGCTFVPPIPAAEAAKYREKVLYSFGNNYPDGGLPATGLIDVNGTLYGTTENGGETGCVEGGCGTVFSVDLKTGAEKVVHFFLGGTDGANPVAGLIDVNGTLYGTTQYGGGGTACGGSGCGTVFSVDPSTGAEKVVYSFLGGTDWQGPVAGLIAVKGKLYGSTYAGGTGGTVFSVDLNRGVEKVLYTFCSRLNCADGDTPEASLIDVNGTLYGTTYLGGTYNGGTVFSLDRKTGAEKVLYSFLGGTDGQWPDAGLIDANGTLYGTTLEGGTGDNPCGTVFSVDPTTGAETVVHAFTCYLDGASPKTNLIAVKGKLYGTTYQGGVHGLGTVFSIDPSTGAEKVLSTFCGQSNCADGDTPEASLIAVNGKLYGTTSAGGAHYVGTVFVLEKKR